MRGLCGVLPSHLRLNMFLELLVFRFVSTLSQQIPRSPLRLALVTLALSLSFVTAIRGFLLLLGHVAPSCDLNTAFLVPKWTSAMLTLICSGRIWYLHVEPGVYKWSSESVASLLRIVSTCSRHWVSFSLKVSLPPARVLLDRVLTVLRPVVSFSHLKSGKKAVGKVASACHMFTNSNRLIGLDRMAFTVSIKSVRTVFYFSSQLGSGDFFMRFLFQVGVHVLHVKSGVHLCDGAAYRTTSSAQSFSISALALVAALYFAFVRCLVVGFFTLVAGGSSAVTYSHGF